MRKAVAVLLIVSFGTSAAIAGLGSDKSMYVGGTTTTIPKGAEGVLNTDDPKKLVFNYQKASFDIPYEKVSSLAYGQHAGRRVGATVAWGVTTLGIMALPILFSKKRKHYLTLEYADPTGASQAAIFELGKGAIRTTLKSLEVRTGKKVEYEDDEARKAGNK
jgi:hypothetical protein